MPRGGKRPGAGAPKGNLNTLKHGRRSRQFAEIGAMLAQSPVARETVLRLAERHQLKQMKADEVAAHLIAQIVARGLKKGRDRLIALPPVRDRHSIVEDSSSQSAPQPATGPKTEKTPPDNQTPDTKTDIQSPNRYGSAID